MYSFELRSSTPTPDRPATTVVRTNQRRVKTIHTPNPTAIDEPKSFAHDDANNWIEVYHNSSSAVPKL